LAVIVLGGHHHGFNFELDREARQKISISCKTGGFSEGCLYLGSPFLEVRQELPHFSLRFN